MNKQIPRNYGRLKHMSASCVVCTFLDSNLVLYSNSFNVVTNTLSAIWTLRNKI